MTQEDGATARQHLMSLWRQTRVKPAQLEVPPCPVLLKHVWEWFMHLHRRRGMGERGPHPLSYTEIKSWSELRNIQLQQYELDAIDALDVAYFAHVQTVNEGNDDG